MTEPLLVIELLGTPKGKGRHRSRIITPRGRKPFVSQYPDPDTVEYEERLADEARPLMAGQTVFVDALSVAVEAFFEVPASWSNKKRAAALAGRIVPTGKPDLDNIEKIVGDALNKIVWHDDSQIVMMQGQKSYALQALLRITVWRWFEPEPVQPMLIEDSE